jgi:eukaryotic-like serine/threonine-protein kinase
VASNDVTMTGRLIGGRYRLLARRGTGATSAVFTGVDIRGDTPVAVKLLHPAMADDPSFVERFNASMGRAMNFDHPNLLKVLGFGVEAVGQRSYLYVVSEQVTGGSLQDIMDRGRLLSPAQALTVGLAVCRGLDHLHRAGMTHRDIRPGSILFDADRVAKVADVGLSAMLAERAWREPTSVDLDRARFASPEQGEGKDVTSATDVYSLALTLVAAITGSVPFVGDSTTATLGNRVGKLLPVSADYGTLASPLERAARPEPADRSTAADFGRGLMQAAANLDRPAPIPIVSTAPLGEQSPPTRQQTAIDPTRVDTPPVDRTGGTSRPTSALPPPTIAVPRDPSGAMPRPVLFDDDAPPPSARSRRRLWWAVGAAVVVIAALIGGLLVSRAMRSQTYAVPQLAGMTRGEAQNQIAGNGWELTITEEESDTVEVDHVIRTDPEAGIEVKEGDPFMIVISAGPPPTPLPAIDGKTVDEASALLTQAGLTPAVQPPQYDETVPQGIVLDWQVPAQPMLAAGDLVEKGTEVQVVPSNGPQPRTMPDMVNVTLERSTAALTERQITWTIKEDFSDTVPAGTVIAQSVAPFTEVPRDSTVDLVVSKGPDVIPFPDLTGLDFNGVVAALTTAGFVAGDTPPAIVAGDRTQGLQQALIDGAPAVTGQTYRRGSAVNLVYPPPPESVPVDTAPPA